MPQNENRSGHSVGHVIDAAGPSEVDSLDLESALPYGFGDCLCDLDPQNFFTSEKWHKPYAQALLESESTELSRMIAEAEHAIPSLYRTLRLPGSHRIQSRSAQRSRCSVGNEK
jgi:hypothetical protein